MTTALPGQGTVIRGELQTTKGELLPVTIPFALQA